MFTEESSQRPPKEEAKEATRSFDVNQLDWSVCSFRHGFRYIVDRFHHRKNFLLQMAKREVYFITREYKIVCMTVRIWIAFMSN